MTNEDSSKLTTLASTTVFEEDLTVHYHDRYKDPVTGDPGYFISWYYGFWSKESKANLRQAEHDQQEFVTKTVREKFGDGFWKWLDDEHGRRSGLWVVGDPCPLCGGKGTWNQACLAPGCDNGSVWHPEERRVCNRCHGRGRTIGSCLLCEGSGLKK